LEILKKKNKKTKKISNLKSFTDLQDFNFKSINNSFFKQKKDFIFNLFA